MTPITASEEPSVEQPQDEPAASEQPTRAPRRRRKATAPQATPENVPAPETLPVPEVPVVAEQVPAQDSPADEAESQPEAQAPAAAPVRRRRRATAAQAAPEVARTVEKAVEAGPDTEAAQERVEASAVTPEEAAGPAEIEDDQVATSETQEEDPDEDVEVQDEAPALPAASLLFQAPDSSRARRRRRVTADTGTPATAPAVGQPLFMAQSEAEEDEQEGASRSRAGRRSAQSSKDAEAASTSGSRQGRRRRKATADSGTPVHVEEAVEAPADAEDGAQGDAAEESTSSPEGAKRGSGRRRRKARGSKASEDERREESVEEDGSQEPEDAETSEDRDEDEDSQGGRRKRRRGGRGRRSRTRGEDEAQDASEEEPSDDSEQDEDEDASGSSRRRRRRSRTRSDSGSGSRDVRDEVTALKGSTRLEAKRQRRREGRAAGRRRPIVSEAEFLARRESVDRQMIVREQDGLNQIAVIEDGLLVEHYVARHTQTSMVGNVYVGRVQNVLPSMEAAFIDLGKGRNAVLYAGEVNWDAAGMEGGPRRIEAALKSGDAVLVQVTKDPIGHKGARLTSQVTLAGRYLVLVPGGSMTGISRKLPDTERSRLKKILKRVVPEDAGVIVRTAAEGASEEQLSADVERLVAQWKSIDKKSKQVLSGSGKAPVLLKGEPELAVRVVRDVFNEDFRKLIVQGEGAWKTISEYVTTLSPDLEERLEHWVSPEDVFAVHRVDEQLSKGFDRKVWLPSGGTLVIDRTEAMTVVDVNTGRFTGAGGTLEETVTRNNIEAAEEIVRQLRLRDIGGMVVIDFVDMVLESNRDLVLRRLVECLGRDRTRHQVTEVTSLGLVQMTRKRVGQGLVEAFSTQCECCGGRGFIVHDTPVENQQADMSASASRGSGSGRGRGRKGREEGSSERSGSSRSSRKDKASDGSAAGTQTESAPAVSDPEQDKAREVVRRSLAQIAAAAEHAHAEQAPKEPDAPEGAESVVEPVAEGAHVAAEAVSETAPDAAPAGEQGSADEAGSES